MGKKSKRAADELENAPTSDAAADMSVDVADGAGEPKSKKKKTSTTTTTAAAAGAKEDDGMSKSSGLVSPIAKPLAGRKTGKHVLKLVKKASKTRHLKRGVKEVVKALRKNEKGIIVLAADISPMDILTHIPLMAEEGNCPYIWVTSKEALGSASSTKRPTSCVMVAQKGMKKKAGEVAEGAAEAEKEFDEMYGQVSKEVKEAEEAVPVY